MTSTDLTAAHENIKAGNLTALGLTSAKRSRLAPDIPTIAERGVPGFAGPASFIGIMAPLGTPPARIRQLSLDIAAILTKPDVQEKIRALSVEPAYEDETAFGAYLVSESAKAREVIKSLAAR